MAGGYKVVLSAEDKVSPVLGTVNKHMEAMTKRIQAAEAPFKRLGENFATFTKVTGLAGIATGFSDVARAGTEAFRSMSRVAEPLAAITGAVSVAGMYRMVEAWSQFSTVLAQTATRAGMSTDGLYTLQNAARLAGVSAETLTAGVTTMNDNFRNAAFGGAPQFLMVLKNLHLSYDELQKMSPEKRLLAISAALSKVANPTDKALYASNIFGGEGLLPLLAKGAQGIEELERRARSLTGVFSGMMAAAGVEFGQSLTAASEASEGLRNSLAAVLGPALRPTVDLITDAVVGMRKWVDVNADWLRGEISGAVGTFVAWLKGVDWAGIAHSIKEIWTDVDGVAQALGGWQRVGEGVLAFYAVRWVAGMLTPFIILGGAVKAIATTIGVELPKAYGLATAAAEAFNTRAMALPVFRALAVAMSLYDRVGDGLSPDHFDPAQRRALGLPDGPAQAMPGEDDRTFWERHAPTWLGGRPAPGGGGTPGGGTAPGAANPSPGAIGPNARYIHDAMIRDGYTEAQAAGMLGHLRGESFRNGDFDPHAFNPDGGGQGAQSIGQWRGERVDRFRARYGHDPRAGNIQEVTEYLLWELRNSERGSGDTLRRETDPGQAAADMVRLFGRPFPQDLSGEQAERSRWGRGWYEQFQPGGAAAPLPSAQPGPPGSAGATGRVDLNVRVQGPASQVTGQTQGSVDLNIARPGLDQLTMEPAVPAWSH